VAWIPVFWAVCAHRRRRGWPSIRSGTARAPVLVAPGAGLPSSAIGTRHPQCKDALAPAASAGATVAWTDGRNPRRSSRRCAVARAGFLRCRRRRPGQSSDRGRLRPGNCGACTGRRCQRILALRMAGSKSRRMEDLLQGPQVPGPWRVPDLMEGQPRRRRCAQTAQRPGSRPPRRRSAATIT